MGRDELAEAMAALVADEAMAVPFVAAYGERLAGVVRSHLRELGRGDVAGDRDEVQGLVWDVALLLHDQGAGWRPGGAAPWTWAWRSIRSLVARTIGHARADVDPEQLTLALDDAPAPAEIDLDEAAGRHPMLGLVRDALAEVACSERQRQVHLEYRLQKALGDPSPAATVAAQFGLTEANVRQIDRRVRVKLTALVVAEDRYRALRAIPWLTDGPGPPTDEPSGGRRRAACAA